MNGLKNYIKLSVLVLLCTIITCQINAAEIPLLVPGGTHAGAGTLTISQSSGGTTSKETLTMQVGFYSTSGCTSGLIGQKARLASFTIRNISYTINAGSVRKSYCGGIAACDAAPAAVQGIRLTGFDTGSNFLFTPSNSSCIQVTCNASECTETGSQTSFATFTN